MLGLYFFVDDYRIEHTRSVYTAEQILTEAGGIATSLIAGLGIFAAVYNYYIYVMHIIYLLYFVTDEKETDKSGFLSKSGRNLFTSTMSSLKSSRSRSDIESPALNLGSLSSSSSSSEESDGDKQ